MLYPTSIRNLSRSLLLQAFPVHDVRLQLVFLGLKYGPTNIENVITQLVESIDGITDPYLGEDVAW